MFIRVLGMYGATEDDKDSMEIGEILVSLESATWSVGQRKPPQICRGPMNTLLRSTGPVLLCHDSDRHASLSVMESCGKSFLLAQSSRTSTPPHSAVERPSLCVCARVQTRDHLKARNAPLERYEVFVKPLPVLREQTYCFSPQCRSTACN